MIDLNTLRAEFAKHMAAQPNSRFSMDSALLAVCQMSYEAGAMDARGHADDGITCQGLRFTKHVPGNPCPSGAIGRKVIVLFKNGRISGARPASKWDWGTVPAPTYQIVGWRYAYD